MSAHISRFVKLGLTCGVLILFVGGARDIPFYGTLGLDLQNLYVFHHCDARGNPYLSTGDHCSDPSGRDMYYPPLMYFAFSWLDRVPFPFATGIWAAAILAGVLWSSLTWGRSTQLVNASTKVTWPFVILLGLQFPTLFAIERGNCDVLVLVTWTVAAHFGLREGQRCQVCLPVLRSRSSSTRCSRV